MSLGVNSLPVTNPTLSWKSAGDEVPDQFPAGLRVLVVDDDPICLMILEKMLRICLYEVTKCSRAEVALKLLMDNRDGFDVVLSDVHMPDMDGFKLLEHIGLEMDLPVIMMSADDSKNVVMKGVTHGACDYLIKPVRIEALKNIWQHVVRKKKHEWKEKDFVRSESLEDGEQHQKPPPEDAEYYSSSANEGSLKSSKRRKDEEDEGDERDDASALKKPRVVWTADLHQQFVAAVNQLGIDKAVPKKILELMNVPGITRENVASHLQKFRQYLKRLSEQHQNRIGNSFVGPSDGPFGSMTPLNGLASSGQIPPESLAAIQAATLGRPTNRPVSLPNQRNMLSFNSKQVNNLLHGIPTNMDSKQLSAIHSPFGNMNNMQAQPKSSPNNSLPTNIVQSQLRSQISNQVSGSHVYSQAIPNVVLGRNGIGNVNGQTNVVDFSRSRPKESLGNTFPFVGCSGRIAGPSSKGTPRGEFSLESRRDSFPSYDVFNDLQNVESTVEVPQHIKIPSVNKAPFSTVDDGFSSVINPGQQFGSSLPENSLRVKGGRLPDLGFQDGLFCDQFGQEDLMSVLKQQEGMVPFESEFGFDEYHMGDLPV